MSSLILVQLQGGAAASSRTRELGTNFDLVYRLDSAAAAPARSEQCLLLHCACTAPDISAKWGAPCEEGLVQP